MLEHAAALLLNLLPACSANDANPLSCNSQSESQGLQQPRRHRLRISRRGSTVCRRGRAQSQQSGFFLGFKMRTNISKKPLLCVRDWVSRPGDKQKVFQTLHGLSPHRKPSARPSGNWDRDPKTYDAQRLSLPDPARTLPRHCKVQPEALLLISNWSCC